ncbi:MAG: amino acid adenylation domain-containing protein [Vicinamibacterales bacterium]
MLDGRTDSSARDNRHAELTDARRTPSSDTVTILLALWRELVDGHPLGPDDEFLASGGDSLRITQCLSRLRAALGVDLTHAAFFAAGTPRAFAAEIDARRELEATPLPPIQLQPRDRPSPLSWTQERLWFVHQLDPHSAAYHVVDGSRITGPLDLDAMRRSFDVLVERHESLRTRFPTREGVPVQVVDPPSPVPLQVVDLTEMPQGEREDRAHAVMRNEAARPFAIEAGPLVRITIVRVGPEDHFVLVVMHHLVTDAWSMIVVARTLHACYQAFTGRAPLQLPDAPFQFADYAAWQRRWITKERLAGDVEFWRAHLSGVTPVELATDRPRPIVQTYRGSFVSVEIDEELLARVRAVARQERATPFMLLLAAFYALLHRYTGQTDLAVAVPIAGRESKESEDIIGALVNTLIVRADLSGEPTMREVLRRVRDVAIQAYDHQSVPFSMVVAELNPARHTGRTPLASIMFNMVNVPMPDLDSPGLESEVVEIDRNASQFDLTFTVTDVPDFRTLSIEFNSDLFDRATMERLLRHYVSLATHALVDLDVAVADASLLSADERHELLASAASTELAGAPRTLHAAFGETAMRQPHATAIVDGDRRVTYDELRRLAKRCAAALTVAGVRPGDRVGIALRRSADAIVAVLGVLEAGAAYVPLDPLYPAERLRFMARDAGLALVVGRAREVASWLDPADASSVRVFDMTAALASTDHASETLVREEAPSDAAPNEDAPNEAAPNEAAYVIYTSGSTGRPKGVVGTHGGMLNRLRWAQRTIPPAPDDVVGQRTSFNFIDAVSEVFGALTAGVPLVVIPDDVVASPAELVRELSRHRVTRVTLVPSLLKAVLDACPTLASDFPTWRLCVASGEALPASLATRFKAAMPGARLFNLYGSSEASGDSTWYEVTEQESDDLVPIGRPMDHVELLVLDGRRQPVPRGVTGELYIGGAGLALGYLGEARASDDRFVPHPFRPAPARLLRTGDRVRQRNDGQIVHLGRLDDEVKVRGVRVSTGEVAAVLRRHPSVDEVVVVAYEDGGGHVALGAYVVLHTDAELRPDALRAHVAAFAPVQMVPAAFMAVASLPLTPNGKVDRRALPPLTAHASTPVAGNIAPRHRLEERLSRIWSRLLQRDAVGVKDNFFDLGGHSLLAAQLFLAIEQEFDVRLPLASLFQAPTVETLARTIQRGSTAQLAWPLVAIQPHGSRLPFFCVHGIGGAVFGYAALARHLGEDQPFYGLTAEHDSTDEVESIEAMAARYIRAIAAVQSDGPYLLGGYSYGGTVAFEMARQLRRDGHDVGVLAMFDHPAPQSGYEVARLNGTFVRGFARNLLPWTRDFLSLSSREQLGRLRRKLLTPRPARVDEVDIGQWMDDVSRVPEGSRQLVRRHLQAVLMYAPRPYDGHVTLFRTSRRPLLCSYDPHLGWGRLALGGVRVRDVPGAHRNLLQAPHVHAVARSLRAVLDEVGRRRRA